MASGLGQFCDVKGNGLRNESFGRRDAKTCFGMTSKKSLNANKDMRALEKEKLH